MAATDAAPRTLPHVSLQPAWLPAYSSLLVVLDAVLVSLAALVANRYRFSSGELPVRDWSYTLFTAGLAPVWVVVLAMSRAYESRFIGTGSEEFKRVFNGSIRLAAVVATTSYLSKAEIARGYVGVAIPLGVVLLLIGRYLARKALHALRETGRCCHRVVVVGAVDEVLELLAEVRREPYAGFVVAGACVLGDQEAAAKELDVPVLGGTDDVLKALVEMRADTVAVAGSLRGSRLRELSWELEGRGVDLVVAPALTDIAGPRIHIRPVAGLALLHVEEPTFAGGRRLLKGGLDRGLGVLLLVSLSPVLLLAAVAIKASSRGPILFRQVRVGRQGQEFSLWKFRSMYLGSDEQVEGLAEFNEHDGLLFKIRRDPRVTPLGRWLRRYSLDELPQLFNVVGGSMSLVGPRPPLPSEVAQYPEHVRRRLLVKPGVTGLWQVSGRSDLSWEESVRLDLYYVENWSPALDFLILWKTAFAVVRGRGAY